MREVSFSYLEKRSETKSLSHQTLTTIPINREEEYCNSRALLLREVPGPALQTSLGSLFKTANSHAPPGPPESELAFKKMEVTLVCNIM